MRYVASELRKRSLCYDGVATATDVVNLHKFIYISTDNLLATQIFKVTDFSGELIRLT